MKGGNSEVADKKRGKPLNSLSSSLEAYPYILTLLLFPFYSFLFANTILRLSSVVAF